MEDEPKVHTVLIPWLQAYLHRIHSDRRMPDLDFLGFIYAKPTIFTDLHHYAKMSMRIVVTEVSDISKYKLSMRVVCRQICSLREFPCWRGTLPPCRFVIKPPGVLKIHLLCVGLNSQSKIWFVAPTSPSVYRNAAKANEMTQTMSHQLSVRLTRATGGELRPISRRWRIVKTSGIYRPPSTSTKQL